MDAVMFYSKSGHSRKIARSLGDALGIPVLEVPETPKKADILYIVSGIYASKGAPELLAAVEKLDPASIKKVVLFTSSAAGSTRQDEVRAVLKRKGIPVAAEEFVCPGQFLFFKRKRPNEQDCKDAVEFARKQRG